MGLGNHRKYITLHHRVGLAGFFDYVIYHLVFPIKEGGTLSIQTCYTAPFNIDLTGTVSFDVLICTSAY